MHQEDTALPVNTAIRAIDQVVGRMVGVRSAESLKDWVTNIRFVVAVGVFKE